MKSLIIHMVAAKWRTLAILGLVMLGGVSTLTFADSGTLSLDSNSSSARFFQGSPTDPDSANTGAARVTGRVKLDANDLDNSVFDLSIYPADEQWGHALSPGGALPAGYVPDSTDHTLLTFHSKRIMGMDGGKLEVIGDLMVTRVVRSITATASETYAGAVYGDPVIQTETREVVFLFPNWSGAMRSGSLTLISLGENKGLDLSGSTRVGHEDLPSLLDGIRDTNWPTVAENKQCQMPSTIGEDYHGESCTGTVVAQTRADNCRIPATIGEDYGGPICTPPAGDQTTIVLDLKMLRASFDPATEMHSRNLATQ